MDEKPIFDPNEVVKQIGVKYLIGMKLTDAAWLSFLLAGHIFSLCPDKATLKIFWDHFKREMEEQMPLIERQIMENTKCPS